MNAAVLPAYAEFAVQSNFSFLRGASRPEELAVTAKLLGYSALGLADRNTVAGVVRAWQQAKVENLAYHPGARLVFSDGTPDILAYPQTRKGWGHLCRMLTQANFRGEKGEPDLILADLLEWSAELSLAILPDLDGGSAEASRAMLSTLKARLGPDLWLAAAPLYAGNDRFRLAQAASLAAAVGLPLMAVNNVLYHMPDRRKLQDVLTAIRAEGSHRRGRPRLAANAERFLKPPGEMARLFRRHPEAIAETQRFLSRPRLLLERAQIRLSRRAAEPGLHAASRLERLTWQGAAERFPDGLPAKSSGSSGMSSSRSRELNYAPYFLTVHDIVKYARSPKASSARAAARRPIRSSAIASASPMSIRSGSTFCSSASSRTSATSRPTSTSTSSMSGAKR